MPAGDVVLAAIAARTTRIHLGSAVIVLSSDDPVRVFQRYSTLNAISGGRAEVILGRGSSIESFPLFGYDLADYERLFEEKTNLFARADEGRPRHLAGHHPGAASRSRHRPPSRVGAVPGLGRRRRQPGVGDPRGPLRVLTDARDHRRPARTLRAILTALPRGLAGARAAAAAGRRARARATSPRPTSKRRRSSGRTGARRSPASAKSAASGPQPKSRSPPTSPPRAPSTSARPRPSPTRSSPTSSCSGRAASTSSSACPASPTTRS